MTSFNISPSAEKHGFKVGGLGAHASRTLMLTELQELLWRVPYPATGDQYKHGALHENVLLKQTEANRRTSLSYLRSLYALDPQVTLFRSLTDIWYKSEPSQPTLALLLALARDEALRSTIGVILNSSLAQIITTGDFYDEARSILYHLSDSTVQKIARNAASSWRQTGFLIKDGSKRRRANPYFHPPAFAYALLLGHLSGQVSGLLLFETPWARLFDRAHHRHLAWEAHQAGWLEYRSSGDVTQITFNHFLRNTTGNNY